MGCGAVRKVLTREDDYATLGKLPCDWDDPKAREALVDALVRDACAALGALRAQRPCSRARRCPRHTRLRASTSATQPLRRTYRRKP
jgi:hypothetical protein